jgi:tetratricopeptide (TPR) repeat protein
VERYAKDTRLSRVLNEIARGYREAQMYQEARPISQYILDNYSGDEQCLWADRDILMCDIRTGVQEAAQARFQKLVGTYGENGYLPYVFNEISGEYRQVQMYSQAKSVSQSVLDSFAGSDQCLWAQRDLVLSSLALNDAETATGGTQNLLTRYANQSGAMWAISEVAEAFSKANQHEQARNLFRFNLTNSPASNDTIWSLRGFTSESIALNDDASTDTGIKKLFSEYAASKNLPMAAVHIGRQLCAAGRPRAAELFQYVLDKHPDHEQALFAKVGMGHVYLLQGEDNQAENLYQKILADYKNRPDLAEAAQLMGENYYGQPFRVGGGQVGAVLSEDAKAYIQKAIAKWNLVLEQMPEVANATPAACYGVARGYYQLGEAQAALHYSEQFVNRWPDHIDARRAYIITFKACKQLLRDGILTRDQVDPLMERAVAVVRSSTLVPSPQQLQGSAMPGDGQGTGGAK